MKFLDRLLKRNTTPAYDTYWNQFSGADVAGVTVNVNSTESISAVYACVAAISESVGSLPLNLYRKTESGREKATTHPLYRLLHDQPNEWQTALEFREQMQRQILLRGNAFAEIKWSSAGRVEALVPLHPRCW